MTDTPNTSNERDNARLHKPTAEVEGQGGKVHFANAEPQAEQPEVEGQGSKIHFATDDADPEVAGRAGKIHYANGEPETRPEDTPARTARR